MENFEPEESKLIKSSGNNEDFLILGEDERKKGVTYKDFVDLNSFEGTNYEEYFEEARRFSSSEDWKEQFFAIDQFRRLNKFAPEIIELRGMEIFPFLDTCLNSPRTYLGKNVLIFYQELYMNPRGRDFIEFTGSIIPTMVIKTAFESNYLRKESQVALQFCAANMAYPEGINALCALSESKSMQAK